MDAFIVEIMLFLIQQVEKYSYCVDIIYFTADVKHSVVRIWEAHKYEGYLVYHIVLFIIDYDYWYIAMSVHCRKSAKST